MSGTAARGIGEPLARNNGPQPEVVPAPDQAGEASADMPGAVEPVAAAADTFAETEMIVPELGEGEQVPVVREETP